MRHLPPPAPASPPLVVSKDLDEAGRAFFPDAVRIDPVAGRDHLARVETPAGAWRVRRWPVGTPDTRIAFVHDTLTCLGDAGVAVTPAVAGLASPAAGQILILGERRYDAQTWLPGQPAGRSLVNPELSDDAVDLPAVLTEVTFIALIEAVARAHAATEDLARQPEVPAVPFPGLSVAVRQAWSAQRARLLPLAPKTPLIQRWLATGERAIPVALAALDRAAPAESVSPVVLHLGLWPAHVLLDADGGAPGDLVGLIGWEGAAAGSPLIDLAHVVARCRGWSAANAEVALAAYAAVRPLDPSERRLLPAVAALALVAATGRLLDLLHAHRGADAPPPSTALRNAAASFVTSLEAATAVAAQGDEPRKPTARRWQHRSPAPQRQPGGPRRGAPRGEGRGGEGKTGGGRERGGSAGRGNDAPPMRGRGERRSKPRSLSKGRIVF